MTNCVVFHELECDNGKVIAVATLNSPKSLNALSGAMIDLLFPQLVQWQNDDRVALVVLQGEGEKAFCAGGDVVHLHSEMAASVGEYSPSIQQYFEKEYTLDYLIHRYKKPIVSWGNGIIMGGGLGLHVGASHRVVTETARIAMPEISIGLFPDVGATWFLNRMPEGCGLFLGLTGASVNAADAKFIGIADSFVRHEYKSIFFEQLKTISWGDTVSLNREKLNGVLRELELKSGALPSGQVKPNHELIKNLTAADNLLEIVNNICDYQTEDKWLSRAQNTLRHGSPLSAQLVYRQLNAGHSLDLAQCFAIELTMAVKSGQFGEFAEGVRALLIDKDNQPQWRFSSVDQVPMETVNWFFTPLWLDESHPLKNLHNLGA